MLINFERFWTLYKQNQDLIQVGAYEQGSNPDLDQAIILRDKMETLLQQKYDEQLSFSECTELLAEIFEL